MRHRIVSVRSLLILSLFAGAFAAAAWAAPPAGRATSPSLNSVKVVAVAPPAPLPPDAREVMDQFQKESAKAQQEMEAKLAPKRKELMAQLKALQDRYTKAGQLDEAVAIRDRLRELALQAGGDVDFPLPNPGTLTTYRERVGQSFYFRVVGDPQVGSVWGTDTYTDDSALGAAVVHAGIVGPFKETTVRVTIEAGRDSYESSSRNGVAAAAYGPWQGSYSVQAVPGAKVVDRPDIAAQRAAEQARPRGRSPATPESPLGLP